MSLFDVITETKKLNLKYLYLQKVISGLNFGHWAFTKKASLIKKLRHICFGGCLDRLKTWKTCQTKSIYIFGIFSEIFG